jgi:hypothetical protein
LKTCVVAFHSNVTGVRFLLPEPLTYCETPCWWCAEPTELCPLSKCSDSSRSLGPTQLSIFCKLVAWNLLLQYTCRYMSGQIQSVDFFCYPFNSAAQFALFCELPFKSMGEKIVLRQARNECMQIYHIVYMHFHIF